MPDATDGQPPDLKAVTIRVVYFGRVQGVGFRYTVRSTATRYPVVGYVKNMPDGTVEMVARGKGSAVEALLRDVAERFQANIRGAERAPLETSDEFPDFRIRT